MCKAVTLGEGEQNCRSANLHPCCSFRHLNTSVRRPDLSTALFYRKHCSTCILDKISGVKGLSSALYRILCNRPMHSNRVDKETIQSSALYWCNICFGCVSHRVGGSRRVLCPKEQPKEVAGL